MKRRFFTVVERAREERGAALVIAMMVMIICALLGAASILTTNTDIQIAMNEKVYHEALMNADAGIQWLRQQDLATMSAQLDATRNATNGTIAADGAPQGIRFQIPVNPVFVWGDPLAGGAPVYRVRSQGFDRNQRGSVTIEAEIRMAPGTGAVEEAGSITTY